MDVQRNDEALFKVRGPIELKLTVETFPVTDERTTILSLQSGWNGLISGRAAARHLSEYE